jgi:hypothetical protein
LHSRSHPYLQAWCDANSSLSRSIVLNPLLLIRKLRLPNLIPPQHHIQRALHLAQQPLIRCRRTPLVIRNNRRRTVTLLRKILLRHRSTLVVLRLGPRLANRLADRNSHRLGLDDVVGAIDFGQALAFGGATAGLGLWVSNWGKRETRQPVRGCGQ